MLLALGTLAVVLSGCSVASAPTTHQTVEASDAATPKAATKSITPKDFNSSQLLGGSVKPSFPEGDAGKVSVVAQGQLSKTEGMGSGMLLIAFRNNTADAVSHVDFSVAAKAGGKVVASGNSQTGSIPAQVQPGEVALDYIYFDNVASVPDTGVTYEFTTQTLPADTSSYNTAALKVTQADNNGEAIIGSATNTSDKTLMGPYGVYAYCFDGDNLSMLLQDYATPGSELGAGDQVAFTVNLYDRTCDVFALGVSGYFK
ncbi:hypothetical protein [Microbacterium sp. 22242]|uniref:hypothetical protein n=1 Tax=Microbacterium sp. 22242 TaxID=3453896 RepID=UPI003F82D15D